MKKFILLSLTTSLYLFGAGYKIPEQSLSATALAGANVAAVKSADVAYYNPANMFFLEDNKQLELSLTYVKLPKINFETSAAGRSGDSKEEGVFIPTIHYVFPSSNSDIIYGISFVTPGGLSKRWDETFQKQFAEEFTLKILELNPSMAYKLNENLSIAAGLRLVYIEGIVKSTGAISREMKGDTFEYGYNLALSYKPRKDINLAATYRSNIDINVEGNAKLYSGTNLVYNGGASVSIPLPAALNLAVSKVFNKLTVELLYERTYWSKYKNLDFEYSSAIPAALVPYFDNPVAKNYKDSNTYRLGFRYKYDKDLELMAGFAIDETPIPNNTVGFELPDSDAKIYSLGFKYDVNDNNSIGAAYLLTDKENRQAIVNSVNGEFTDAKAHLLTFGYAYKF